MKRVYFGGLLFFTLKKVSGKLFLLLVAAGLLINGAYLWLEHSGMHELDHYYKPLIHQYKGEITEGVMKEISVKNQEMQNLLASIYKELEADFLKQVFGEKDDIIGSSIKIDKDKKQEADRRLSQPGKYTDTVQMDIWLWGHLYRQTDYLYRLSYQWQEMKEIAQRNIGRSKNENSYTYREWNLYSSRISALKAPLLDDMQAWEAFFKCYGNDVIMLVLILLILSPVFSNDYANGMFKLQKSTKYGMFGLTIVKVCTAIIIITAIFIIYTLQHAAFLMFYNGGFGGIHQPLQAVQYFSKSIQPWAIGEYIWIMLGLKYLSCISLALMTLAVSSISRTSFVTFIASGILCYLPFVIGKAMQESIPTSKAFLFSYSSAFNVNNYYSEFTVWNVLNQPISLGILVYGVLVILCFIYYGFIVKRMKYVRP